MFDAAKENDRLQQVSEELADFAAAVHDVPELRAVLRNPQLDPRAKVGVLDELLGGAEPLVRNFLRLTAEKGRIGQIEDIAREFDRLLAREERRLEETRRQIEAETHRALEQIRAEVADLTLVATAKVTGKVLDDADHKRLIEDAIRDLDFSALEEAPR